MTGARSSAVHAVLAERARQITDEGFTAEHDDRHDKGELALAAVAYVNVALRQYGRHGQGIELCEVLPQGRLLIQPAWPWLDTEPKPKGLRSNLVRAAALLIAEIERVDRAALRDGGNNAAEERQVGEDD